MAMVWYGAVQRITLPYVRNLQFGNAMAKATVTYKGQITLPKTVREQLGVQAGDRVSFREIEGGMIVVEADTVDLMELRGSMKPRRKGVTIEDMDQAILSAAAHK